jgi:hypothetical protein
MVLGQNKGKLGTNWKLPDMKILFLTVRLDTLLMNMCHCMERMMHLVSSIEITDSPSGTKEIEVQHTHLQFKITKF